MDDLHFWEEIAHRLRFLKKVDETKSKKKANLLAFPVPKLTVISKTIDLRFRLGKSICINR